MNSKKVVDGEEKNQKILLPGFRVYDLQFTVYGYTAVLQTINYKQ